MAKYYHKQPVYAKSLDLYVGFYGTPELFNIQLKLNCFTFIFEVPNKTVDHALSHIPNIRGL